MYIRTKRLVIRDIERKDEQQLLKIICQKNIVKFMKDWYENSIVSGVLANYIDWLQSQKNSTDVYENKRYAITLLNDDKFIGMVGMGLAHTLNEVEMAYFIDEEYQCQGLATEALQALFDWCISVSDLTYLILTIDCTNYSSCRVAEKAGFKLFEKRIPIGHVQTNMVSDSYFYYRKYK